MRHPLHSALVHVPFGALALATLCDGGSWALHAPVLAEVARTDLLLGLIASVPAVGSGLMDLKRVPRDDGPTGAAIWHIGAMLSALMLYLVSYLLRRDPALFGPASAVGGVGLLALGFGGFMGGELVHRFGVGRRQASDAGESASLSRATPGPSPRTTSS